MNTKFVFAVVAVCLIQATASLRVARNAPAQPNPLEDLQKRANEIIANLDATVNKLMGVKNDEERNKLMKTNTDNFLNKVGEMSQTLKEKLGETGGQVQTMLNDASNNIKKTVEELKAKHPEVEKQAEQLATNVKNGISSVTTELEKVGKTLTENSKGVNDDLAKLLKKSYADVVQAAEVVQKQLHEAANKA